jgi:hypothetical protein
VSGFARKLQRISQSTSPNGGSTIITHGDQLTPANTGYTAYYDSVLGRTLQLSDLATVSGTHYVSDFASPGDTLYKKRFTGSLIMDINNVTVRGCLFDNPVSGYLNGNHATGWILDYCSIVPAIVGDQAIYYQSYTANRCYIVGCSDGVKADGGNTILTECYIRVKLQSAQDHNDGIQNVGGNGSVTIARCNIDGRPIGGGTDQNGNSALFFADGEVGLHTIFDNLLAGGQVSVALYDSGTFNVQGNKFVRDSYQVSTHAMAGPGSGAQNVTWGTVRANTYSDTNEVIPL